MACVINKQLCLERTKDNTVFQVRENCFRKTQILWLFIYDLREQSSAHKVSVVYVFRLKMYTWKLKHGDWIAIINSSIALLHLYPKHALVAMGHVSNYSMLYSLVAIVDSENNKT